MKEKAVIQNIVQCINPDGRERIVIKIQQDKVSVFEWASEFDAKQYMKDRNDGQNFQRRCILLPSQQLFSSSK